MKDLEKIISNKNIYLISVPEKHKTELIIADFTQPQPIVFKGVNEIERLRDFLNSLDLD